MREEEAVKHPRHRLIKWSEFDELVDTRGFTDDHGSRCIEVANVRDFLDTRRLIVDDDPEGELIDFVLSDEFGNLHVELVRDKLEALATAAKRRRTARPNAYHAEPRPFAYEPLAGLSGEPK
ncbi:MAG: hypothetical protein AAF581_11115 [Planctomycetota bacterium]